jgi:hypothetical protein
LIGAIVGCGNTSFFNDIQTLTRYLYFDSWDHLLDFMLKQLELDISPAPT